MQEILSTERLVLRELTLGDLDALHAIVSDPRVMAFWPQPLTRDEAVAWIERQQARYAADGFGYWLALDRTTQAPVGQAGILMCTVDGVAEPALGYILHQHAWGKGLAVEASRACVRWAFDHTDAERVICLIRPENVPSLRVAVRLGFMPERHVRYAGLDHLLFTISRSV